MAVRPPDQRGRGPSVLERGHPLVPIELGVELRIHPGLHVPLELLRPGCGVSVDRGHPGRQRQGPGRPAVAGQLPGRPRGHCEPAHGHRGHGRPAHRLGGHLWARDDPDGLPGGHLQRRSVRCRRVRPRSGPVGVRHRTHRVLLRDPGEPGGHPLLPRQLHLVPGLRDDHRDGGTGQPVGLLPLHRGFHRPGHPGHLRCRGHRPLHRLSGHRSHRVGVGQPTVDRRRRPDPRHRVLAGQDQLLGLLHRSRSGDEPDGDGDHGR